MVQLNPVPVFGTKKILVPFNGKFSPKFPYKWQALQDDWLGFVFCLLVS